MTLIIDVYTHVFTSKKIQLVRFFFLPQLGLTESKERHHDGDDKRFVHVV